MKRKSVLAILLSTALTVSTVTPVTAVAAEEPVLQTSQEELPAITDVGTEVNDLVDVSLEQTDEAAGNFRIVFTPHFFDKHPSRSVNHSLTQTALAYSILLLKLLLVPCLQFRPVGFRH